MLSRACGDTAEPSAVIIDSRSCQSAPTCFGRGFDGGKRIKGIKIHLAVNTRRAAKLITASPWRSSASANTSLHQS
jgi:hypothetical protein